MIDLHLHTTASDGELRPADLVNAAHAAGLTVISITDHDTTAGLDEAMRYIEISVVNGLQDHLWMQKCPLLDKVRDRPRFRELLAITAERAKAVIDVLGTADRPHS